MFSIEETENGYSIHFKGDKEKLKARIEAIEAYHKHKHGFLSLIHKHMMSLHDKNSTCSQEETTE